MNRSERRQREQVRERAEEYCEFCRFSALLTGQEFTVDHIIPRARGGSDDLENLCYCCFWCNNAKSASTEAMDPRTGQVVSLFHPRSQVWEDHFRWSPTGAYVLGRTAVGRATVELMQLRRSILVRARKIWSRHGLHPPRPPAE